MFGQVMRDQLKRAGMTQRAVANALNVSENAVYLWVSGRRVPSMNHVVRLERLLGCEPGTLLLPLAYPVDHG